MSLMISKGIKELIRYRIRTGLLDQSEEIYTRNLLLDLFDTRIMNCLTPRPKEVILQSISGQDDLNKHADWMKDVLHAHPEMDAENAEQILQQEIGDVFVHVLEDAGIYKWTQQGHEGFLRFLREVGKD